MNQIVFASTSAIYGDTAEKTDENHGPLNPVSHYGAAKLSSEAFISSFVNGYEMRAFITRFPNVVGERCTHGVIYDFINKLRKNPSELEVLGDGEQNKPYLYVKDVVDAIVYIWKNATEKINVYNIGVETRTRVKDIARMVLEQMGSSAPIRYTGGKGGWKGDVPQFQYDISKIKRLGWNAKYTSDESVLTAIKKVLSKEQCRKKDESCYSCRRQRNENGRPAP